MESSSDAVSPRARARRFAARVIELTTLPFLCLCGALLLLNLAGFQIVYTPSVPVGLYHRHRIDQSYEPKLGEYVCIEGWRAEAPALFRATVAAGIVPRDWGRDEPLVKRVAGLPGDVVTYVDEPGGRGHIEVNGRQLPASERLKHDGGGARLPRPSYPFVLASDEVWLMSDHPRGFDSRYYGPVRHAALGCSTKLLWAW